LSPSDAAAPSDKLLIPDTRLPFNLLRMVDANLKLALADVRFDGVDIRKIDGVAAVKDGQLRVEPFGIAAPDQRMSGTLLADATKTPPVVHLVVNAPALAVQPLLGVLGLPEVASGTAQVQADLTGTGDSPHAIAASLDGWAGVAIEGGQLDTKMMNAWLDRVQPLHFSGPDVTELRCFALRADLKSGIATIEPVALSTPALIVDGSGDVDLGRETLALQVRPRAKIGGTGIAVPVRVSGPLREPSAKIDISAKGFGGLSGLLLGGKDVMGAAGGGDPCPAALARAREAVPASGPKP
jgi:AsmA protein